jgi:hypothetical protein
VRTNWRHCFLNDWKKEVATGRSPGGVANGGQRLQGKSPMRRETAVSDANGIEMLSDRFVAGNASRAAF